MTRQASIRVLAIGSDPILLRMLAAIFQRRGWDVATTADGEAALALLRTDLPDVFVIDLLLPRSVPDVLEWIAARHAPWLRHVIVLTAASRRVHAELMKCDAVCRVIDKPFDINELVAHVESCATPDGAFRQQRRAVSETAS